MQVNYDDKRFTEVENDKKEALNEVDKTYGEMISNSDSYFNKQINASKEWADTQKDIQQDRTDFTIEQINQQKEQARQDYIKEQSGSYVDWQKQSNQYGANAEQMASAGLTGTGYSESSQVSMYNQYQTRLIAARDSYNRAVLNYNNAIKDAQLQNNAALAEIAYNALQQQLELSLQGFQYKNTLVLAKAEAKRTINSEYYNRWKDVLNQINTENALAEEQRQFNENMAFQKDKLQKESEQFQQQIALETKKFQWQQDQAAKSSSSGGSSTIKKSSGSSSSKSSSSGLSSKGQSMLNSSLKTDPTAKQKLVSTINSKNFSYETATQFMKANGLSTGGVRLLTSKEWSQGKRAGEQGSELEYSSYREYVKNYLLWRVQNS